MGLSGKEKNESRVAEALVRKNVVQALCTFVEAVKQQIIRAKH